MPEDKSAKYVLRVYDDPHTEPTKEELENTLKWFNKIFPSKLLQTNLTKILKFYGGEC